MSSHTPPVHADTVVRMYVISDAVAGLGGALIPISTQVFSFASLAFTILAEDLVALILGGTISVSSVQAAANSRCCRRRGAFSVSLSCFSSMSRWRALARFIRKEHGGPVWSCPIRGETIILVEQRIQSALASRQIALRL